MTDPREQEFGDEYDKRAAELAHLGVLVERLLVEILAADGQMVHSVNHRVKAKQSVRDKLTGSRSSATSLIELTDVLGVRVITYFADQVDDVARVVRSAFDVDEENSIDKRAILEPDRFGYLSLHFVVQISSSRAALPEYVAFAQTRFEIQIRSILQHSWAEIEHDLGYKSIEAVPRETRRRFSRLAGLLELVDEEFVSLRRSLREHEAKVGQVVREGGDVAIDRDSVFALMSSELVRTTDARIGERTGAIIKEPSHSYANSRTRGFRQLGFESTKAVTDALAASSNAIVEFATSWLMRPDVDSHSPAYDEESGTWTELPAGISLFYLERHLEIESGNISAPGRYNDIDEYIAAHAEALLRSQGQ